MQDYSYSIKAAPRFELGVEDLQSTALPLGHTANYHLYYKVIIIDKF